MLRELIIDLLMTKEEKEMVAMLWAQKIIYGKKNFSDVPEKLKDKVREILIESDLEELMKEGE